MVEGQGSGQGERDPLRPSGVIAAGRRTAWPCHEEGNRGRGFTRVAVRSGVDANDCNGAAKQAGLLAELSDQRLLDRFPKFHEPARKGPEPTERRAAPPDQQHPTGPDPDRVHGESRVPISRAHSGCEPSPVLGLPGQP